MLIDFVPVKYYLHFLKNEVFQLIVSDKHIHAVHILNNIGQLHPTLFSIIS